MTHHAGDDSVERKPGAAYIDQDRQESMVSVQLQEQAEEAKTGAIHFGSTEQSAHGL